MQHVFTDGGRAAAGHEGRAGDCVVRAIAIAAEMPYQVVYDAINSEAAKERPREGKGRSTAEDGVWRRTISRYMRSIGWKWTSTMGIGTGCRVHLRADELPSGRLVVKVSQHVLAVIDGAMHDIPDSSRGGKRCVYGYWSKPTT